jgi:hypothetical protein
MRHCLFASALCLSALLVSACAVAPGDEVDEPLTETDAGKADEIGDYRHYLLWAEPSEDGTGPRHLARAGGGSLRCPDGVIREVCDIEAFDFLPTLGLRESPDAVFDELAEHAMISRGRLVRTDTRVYLRASALTRGITGVEPAGTCYRIRPRTEDPFFDLEQLDTDVTEATPVLFFDNVDPSPDFWGQPTAAVQARIDAALELARTRPVFTCGEMDRRDTGDLYWASQVFAPM